MSFKIDRYYFAWFLIILCKIDGVNLTYQLRSYREFFI